MVGRLVEDQHISTREHHAREHAADALAAREYLGALLTLLARKEHPSEEATYECLVRILGVLA